MSSVEIELEMDLERGDQPMGDGFCNFNGLPMKRSEITIVVKEWDI